MALSKSNSEHTITRLPFKIKIDKEDLESEDDRQPTQKTKPAKKKKKISKGVSLASELNTGVNSIGIYVDLKPGQQKKKPKKSFSEAVNKTQQLAKELSQPDKLLEKSVIQPGFEKLEAIPKYSESHKRLKKERKAEAEKTKGDKWFNLPATEMTEEKLRDLEIIQMRSILNPKQFYKKNDLKVVPKYFQVGTVVDSPVDFYHDRVPRKERKKTLVDELMADANFQNYNKRKYADIIQSKPQPRQSVSKKPRRSKKNK